MTTPKKPTRARRSRTPARTRKPRTTEPAPEALAEAASVEPSPPAPAQASPPTVDVEPLFVARVPPPGPRPPLPSARRAVFFDVENTSRAEHIHRVLRHLALDWQTVNTELIGVGNWRVIGHDTARLLARHGAQLVHSAPSVGVRDWSDLRIAVAAGAWLATTRPGDVLEIITDDQAFDAVGDVAASLGVAFRRLSYRALTGMGEIPVEEAPRERSSRRRRRGGRRGGRGSAPPRHVVAREPMAATVANGTAETAEPHTAPHDELLAVAQELIEASADRSVSLDALSNALKARGFSRPPGSPRLVTRLRRIKELEVGRQGTIRLVAAPNGDPSEPPRADDVPHASSAEDVEPSADTPAAVPAGPRRRRRRGGRRRRGRGGSNASSEAPAPEAGS